MLLLNFKNDKICFSFEGESLTTPWTGRVLGPTADSLASTIPYAI